MVPRFRCWDKDSKVMRSWKDLILTKDDGDDFWLIGYKENACITSFDHDQILMQSTGLKDKNGVEIFEGDIVVNQYGNVGYVAYLQQEAGFVVVLKKSDYRLGHRNTGESYDVTTNHEVIGNIHSNPELLEQANEN
ncbi:MULTISPECIES: YopX family protein [Bacteria]|uniref:YopX family protein n=1 Tax=Bacteria TaxID=2 RepID=UPI00115C6E57|nr:YopX family protein [Enterococcus casseliflavus]